MAEQSPAVPSATGCHRQDGFTLVEVALALGITAFVCATILGLLPIGLTSFRQATGTTVESQIVQNLSNDFLLANFSDLYLYNNQSYYYDNEGTLLTTGAGALFTAKVTMASVTLSNSPADLADHQVATAAPTSPPAAASSAYKVNMQLTNSASPAQPHVYSVIVANNNL